MYADILDSNFDRTWARLAGSLWNKVSKLAGQATEASVESRLRYDRKLQVVSICPRKRKSNEEVNYAYNRFLLKVASGAGYRRSDYRRNCSDNFNITLLSKSKRSVRQ